MRTKVNPQIARRLSLFAGAAFLVPVLGSGVAIAAAPATGPTDQTVAPTAAATGTSNEAAPTPGAATEANQAPAAQGGHIEEVVVTARRTEERAQHVPIALVALSQKTLNQQAVLSATDLETSTPGLYIATDSQGNDPTFAIRGAKEDSGTSPTVAVYVDDVPVVSTLSVANMVYDMQSITTLKGPQGTLFGANSDGGAIIFRPNKPTDQFGGYIMGGLGDYNRREVQGMINVPVNEKVELRVAGELVRRDGFETNISPLAQSQSKKMDSDDHESARVSLRLKISDSLTNDTVFDYYHVNDQPNTEWDAYYRPNFNYATFLGFSVPANYAAYGIHTLKPFQVQTNGDPFYSRDLDFGFSNTTNWEVTPDWALKLVIGYRNDNENNSQSQDSSLQYSTSNGVVVNLNEQWTLEPSSTITWDDGRYSNKTGMFFIHQTQQIDISYSVLNEPFVFTGVPPSEVALVKSYYPLQSNVVETTTRQSAALYDQLSWKLSDELTATMGGRLTYDQAGLVVTNRTDFPSTPLGPYGDYNYGPCDASTSSYQNFNAAACTGTRSIQDRNFIYSLSVEDRFAPGKMLFASVKRGYLEGGFNNPVTVPAGQIFGPETVEAFEGGLKADWDVFGRPLRTNVAGFYGTYEGQQRVSNHLGSTGTGYVAVANAGSSVFYGTDVDFTFAATDYLTLFASYEYLNAKYTNYNASLSVPFITAALDLTGVQEAQAPQNQLTVGATVNFPLPENYGALSATLSSYYRSTSLGHDAPTIGGTCAGGGTVCVQPGEFIPNPAQNFTKYDVLPGFNLVNLTVMWNHIAGYPVDGEFYVKNLTNQIYYTSTNNQLLTLGWAGYYLGDPRTFGVRLRYNF
jgi:outer membrane receptor protein involved in Fe transport